MKRNFAVLPAVAVWAVLVGCAAPNQHSIEPLVDEFSGRSPAQERSPEALQAAYGDVIDALVPAMAAPNVPDRETAQQTFATICLYAGRPDAKTERLELCNAIVARLGANTPQPARVWLIRQLERIGRGECAPALAALLDDADGELRELARKALQNNLSDEAGAALRAALGTAKDPAWQAALINALAARRDTACVAALIKIAQTSSGPAQLAAIAALGDIGGDDARAALAELWRAKKQAELRPAIADAWLHEADRLLLASRQTMPQAAAIYEELYRSAEPGAPGLPIRMSALRGLALARGPQFLPNLLDLCADDSADFELRGIAANLVVDLAAPETTATIAERLPNVSPIAQVLLLRSLELRGDAKVRPAVTALLSSTSADVRAAAARALLRVGDAASLVPLAQAAADGEGPVRDAARNTLARLRGEHIDPALIATLGSAPASQTSAPTTTTAAPMPPELRVELIKALAARRTRSAVPALFKEAQHAAPQVRIAAFEALGTLTPETGALDLIGFLMMPNPDSVREAAEQAVVAICARIDDPTRRLAPIFVLWSEADIPVRTILVRVLGRLGGPAALERIRESTQSRAFEIQDAAVRALARWPTTEVLDDLLDLAQHGAEKTHRVLALQGYIRLLGLPSERDPQTTVSMYKTALSLAERPEDKRAVLSGVAGVRDLAALNFAEQYLEDAELRPEAEAAVVSVARNIGPLHRDEALRAIERVAADTTSAANREAAQKARKRLGEIAGYAAAWLLAGPYAEPGEEWPAIFAKAYPPEVGGGKGVAWQTLKVSNADQPWLYDLTTIDKEGQRCVYVQSAVWSPDERPARLEIGSDDAVKVWLNGRLIHEFKGIRAHSAFEDKVPVKLKAGWNTVMLKVVQSTGGWAFSCAVRNPDGTPPEGLRLGARPE